MLYPPPERYRIKAKNYIYVVPCYNESAAELCASLESLIEQRIVAKDKRCIVIICDGKVKGAGNSSSTDQVLIELLQLVGAEGIAFDYLTWTGRTNTLHAYTCDYSYHAETVPILLLIKETNYGKRDSLVLLRQLCYAYNMHAKAETDTMTKYIFDYLAHIYHAEKIDYLIGIDADTVFDYNCTYELIQGIDYDASIHGCVGYVDISPQMNFSSWFVLYQYAEYAFAQCLRRQAQSNITHKVSCLSGCNQILRISEETCGEKILKVFNYFPTETDSIFTHIRSYASEDRNHICNLLSLYPYVKTAQTLKAISYTTVPTSVAVFLSQRRRWNLGANTNDMLLVYLPGINIFERILAGINVFTFSITPFIGVATVYFLVSIITQPTLLMLYLSSLILIPVFYSFLIPLFIKPLNFKDTLYYYFSYLFFVTWAGLVSLACFLYAVLQMDVITWGKTRSIENAEVKKQEIEWEDSFNFDIII
jgi:chitin synthase